MMAPTLSHGRTAHEYCRMQDLRMMPYNTQGMQLVTLGDAARINACARHIGE